VGSEVIRINRLTPPRIDAPRPRLARADAILPVIVIRKAPARPADHRRRKLPNRFDDVRPDAIDVGDRRVCPNPNPFVDASPKMLGEVPVQLRADSSDRRFVGVDNDPGGGHRMLLYPVPRGAGTNQERHVREDSEQTLHSTIRTRSSANLLPAIQAKTDEVCHHAKKLGVIPRF